MPQIQVQYNTLLRFNDKKRNRYVLADSLRGVVPRGSTEGPCGAHEPTLAGRLLCIFRHDFLISMNDEK